MIDERTPIFVQAAAQPQAQFGFYVRIGKRLFDMCLAAIGIVATFPLFVICYIAVRLSSSGPVFFRQKRIGQFGIPFSMLKFRTMVNRTGGPNVTVAGDPRVTRIGRWLRKSKLDELPQLLNIFLGQMSFVGPRPEVPEFVAAYTEIQKRVLDAKPGITGPASIAFAAEDQILARVADPHTFYLNTVLPYKLRLDISYCSDIRFSRDVALICQTVLTLVLRHTIAPEL